MTAPEEWTEVADEVAWEDPPPGRTSGSRSKFWRDVVEVLRQHPGKWARLPARSSKQDVYQDAHRINTGGISAVSPAKEFEAQARKLEDESAVLYMRYVGSRSSEESADLEL